MDSGEGDGMASAEVSGGTPDYSVAWTSFGTPANPDSLSQGLYTVTVTDANGCIAAESFTVGVDRIGEFEIIDGSVYPVPVGDVLNIRLTSPLYTDALVHVHDAQGRVLMTDVVRQGNQFLALDAASWSAGVYTIQLSTEGARASWSFVK